MECFHTNAAACVAVLCLTVLASANGQPLAPTSPKSLAKSVGDEILVHKDVFFTWGYGGALVLDGLWRANETFGLDYASAIGDALDHYLQDTTSPAYQALHNETMHPSSAIGDYQGLYPIAYLNRAVSYSDGAAKRPAYSNTTDMHVARYIADNIILKWPLHLSDGTVSRNHGWPGQEGNGTFLWGDDQYMGLTLVSRLAVVLGREDYAAFAAEQTVLFEKHMRDKADGLFYHGYNDADHEESCCKWGRANGWGMFSHVEVLRAVERFPNLQPQAVLVKAVLQRHLDAILPFQSEDGRWRQLVNDTDSFLETSCTAMFASVIARSMLNKWVDVSKAGTYFTAAMKGFSGLTKTVSSTGEVSGVCSGTGIQTDADAYRRRPTSYLASGPGGLGAVLSAAVDVFKLQDAYGYLAK